MKNCALLLFSFLLIVSCGKKDTQINNETVITSQKYDSPESFTSTALKERYFAIEDSIGSYVEKLEEIENRYYTGEFGNDELLQLSLSGLELQERLTRFLKNCIDENIYNPLGIYMLAVYSELFTADELHSLVQRIPPYPAYTTDNPFYEIIMLTTERIEK